LVFAGPNWFIGVLFVFGTAHLPAIYLAKWTEADTHLPFRCALLSVMTGGMLFAVLPSLIMQAMGGSWNLFDKPTWAICVTVGLLAMTSLIGVAANQTLCLQGSGTPIPLDPTKRLVTTGIYAYLSNPMQLSAALGCVVLGGFLQNIWVMAAAVMAWVFVQGMVRWHNRNDLLKRFPTGWPEYKAHVPEWIPRWTPWIPLQATVTLCTSSKLHQMIAPLLDAARNLDIQWSRNATAAYKHPDNIYDFHGSCAVAAAVMHKNFAFALLSHAWLLLVLPLRSTFGRHQ
jgi:protein-S-isoprenylcysteine O-methyltransferase Ste14